MLDKTKNGRGNGSPKFFLHTLGVSLSQNFSHKFHLKHLHYF